jgi:hypothetical protein
MANHNARETGSEGPGSNRSSGMITAVVPTPPIYPLTIASMYAS